MPISDKIQEKIRAVRARAGEGRSAYKDARLQAERERAEEKERQRIEAEKKRVARERARKQGKSKARGGGLRERALNALSSAGAGVGNLGAGMNDSRRPGDESADAVARRAEDTAMMGPPVDADLTPLHAPERTGDSARGGYAGPGADRLGEQPRVDDLVYSSGDINRQDSRGGPVVDELVFTDGDGGRDEGRDDGFGDILGGDWE